MSNLLLVFINIHQKKSVNYVLMHLIPSFCPHWAICLVLELCLVMNNIISRVSFWLLFDYLKESDLLEPPLTPLDHMLLLLVFFFKKESLVLLTSTAATTHTQHTLSTTHYSFMTISFFNLGLKLHIFMQLRSALCGSHTICQLHVMSLFLWHSNSSRPYASC